MPLQPALQVLRRESTGQRRLGPAACCARNRRRAPGRPTCFVRKFDGRQAAPLGYLPEEKGLHGANVGGPHAQRWHLQDGGSAQEWRLLSGASCLSGERAQGCDRGTKAGRPAFAAENAPLPRPL